MAEVATTSASAAPGGALIVGGTHGSLAMARSLGRRGIAVGFLTDDHQLTGYSRYARFSATWNGPSRADAAAELLAFGRARGLDGWVLLAGGDAEAQMVARKRADLAAFFRVTTPDWESARFALDKKLTYQRAAELGIDHPWSHYPRDRQDIVDLECRFPLVLKPTVRSERNAFTLAKAWRIDDRAALIARYDQAVAAAGENSAVLQEMIPGGGEAQFSYAGVFDRGQPVASLVARRTRQFPVEFGYSSTFVESIDNKIVEDAGERFLRSIDYSGLAEIEFKYDARDDRYKILDVNVRAWTWNSLGVRAGTDFTHVLWQLMAGQGAAPAPARGRPGVAWMHASRDIVAACQHMLSGRLSPLDYLRSFSMPLEFAAFAWDDPLPGLLDLPLVAARLATRRLPLMARGMVQRLAS